MKKAYFPIVTLLAFSSGFLFANDSYLVETVTFPDDMPVEVGALDFDSNGDLYLAIRRGDILIAKPRKNPEAFEWRHFASGFHNPCGMFIVKPGHIIISQMAELTEVIDEDNDGVADIYRALSTGIGLSGNYHETMDICSDGNGGLYLAPGTASKNGPTFTTPRGSYSDGGRLGRNYSSVKWRGWVLHWRPGKELTPVSSGYRMHNGIERSPKGDIWCGDNQGDWRSSSPVYHVTEDSFAGHPSSLVWDERFEGVKNPLHMPRILLDDLWNKPAFRLARSMMNSCAEPAFIPEDDSFGPFGGQMLIPDQSGQRIVRCMPEWVDGNYQGAARLFIEKDGLLRGNNRLAFSPAGDMLYVGQTGRGWGKMSEGLQRLVFTGEPPFEVTACSLTADGFEIQFTEPVKDADRIEVERYRYNYGFAYGGDEEDKTTIELSPASGKGSTVKLAFASADQLLPNHVYRMKLDGVKSADGDHSIEGELVYTLNRLVRPESESKTTIEKESDRYRIEIDGKLFTEYRTEGFANPILFPIVNPSGQKMTRDWPILEDGRANEAQDHRHHKSLFIGHQSVNGIDFWHEKKNCGTIEHARTIETRGGEDRALIRTFNQWRDVEGEVIGTDTRELQFGTLEGGNYIDLELNIHASHGELVFGEMKDGLVALRTHPHLRLREDPEKGVDEVFGQAENSEGIVGKDVWGERADWIHFYGKVEGSDAGIAILAHPDNPRSPTWWHARSYGLLAANPFSPTMSGGYGELVLPQGETLTLRYRFIFHDKAYGKVAIADHFATYSNSPLVPRTLTLPIPAGEVGASSRAIPDDVSPRGDVITKVVRTVNGEVAEAPKILTHGFVEGATVFSDREDRFERLPEFLRGGDLVETFNADKDKGQDVSYQVTITEPGMLYVLVDSRREKSLKWLTGESLEFTLSPEIIRTDGDCLYKVFSAEVDPGEYQLGNQSGGSFYSIVGVNRD